MNLTQFCIIRQKPYTQLTPRRSALYFGPSIKQLGIEVHVIFGSTLIWNRMSRGHCLKSFWYIKIVLQLSTMDIILTLNFIAALSNFLPWEHFASIIFTLKFIAALRQFLTLRTFCQLVTLKREIVLFSSQASP